MSVFFNALTVDPCAIDAELEDAGAVGPELAFIAKEQRLLPRALCWRDASSDWPLLIVQIPGTEALWMLQHPVFTPIIRRWGMALRVIGISREAMAYDFRALLSDSTLAKLRSALRDDPQQAPVDLIYQALAQGMLTRLHPSGQMAKHLLREGYIHPNSEAIEPADSAHRPLLIKALQTALRRGQLDIGFYSRAMRAIRRRESLVQQRLAFIFEGALSPLSLQLCAPAMRPPANICCGICPGWGLGWQTTCFWMLIPGYNKSLTRGRTAWCWKTSLLSLLLIPTF
ncbi:MAG: hypothetical protein EBS52_05525 [Betaproteobacteria bacterium]|nr:hypothetical protein [Betaproteobacteria bacterium]